MIKVGIIMGSNSDYEVMQDACKVLEEFGVEYEKKVHCKRYDVFCLFKFG